MNSYTQLLRVMCEQNNYKRIYLITIAVFYAVLRSLCVNAAIKIYISYIFNKNEF